MAAAKMADITSRGANTHWKHMIRILVRHRIEN